MRDAVRVGVLWLELVARVVGGLTRLGHELPALIFARSSKYRRRNLEGARGGETNHARKQWVSEDKVTNGLSQVRERD